MSIVLNKMNKNLVVLTIAIIGLSIKSFAQPCYSGFNYRLPVYVDNSSNAEEKALQISITLNTSALVSAGKMQSSGADFRVLDRLGNPLNLWIEDGTMNTSATKIWVKTDSIIAYGKDTLYLFYGSSSASTVSNRASTYTLYDDFSGSSVGSAWSACGSGSSTVSSGALTLTSGSTTQRTLKTNTAFTGPLIIEMKVNSSSGGNTFLGASNTSDNGYAMIHNGSVGQYRMTSSGSCYTPTSINSTTTAGTIAGVWTFRWDNVGSQKASWPSGTSNAAGTAFSFGQTQKVILGCLGGTLEVDWIQARRYTASTMAITFGTEVSNTYTITPTYNSPICEGQDLKLTVNAVPGATYSWTGPSGTGFTSTQREPTINGVKLTDAGQYTVKVTIPTGCATQTKTVNVSITNKSIGGILSGSASVCSGSNTGTVTLSGQTGNIQGWDSASSASGPWYGITSTSNSRPFLDLSGTTLYRVLVKNGVCPVDTSTNAIVTVTPASYGGSVIGADTVCAGSNSGSLYVTGAVGNIERWESSTNGFLWTSIVNRSTIQSYNNLSTTTFYRAVAKNGLCNEAASSPQKITVDASTIGGTATGTQIACEGNNTGIIVLSGNRGSVVQWEYSANNTSPWTQVNNTTDTLEFQNITYSTYFRAIVRNGVCNQTPSTSVGVSVIDASDAGTLSGSVTVCESSNSGVVIVNNNVGSIVKWQYANKNTSGWIDISTISNSVSWSSLSDTTEYRVIVSNQGCTPDTSAPIAINVNKFSESGYHIGDDHVCEGTNSGQIKLLGYLGDIKKWEYSTTGFAPWLDAVNNSDSLSFVNLTTDLFFRAVVQNGVCSQVKSSPFKVQVDVSSDGGIVLNDAKVCSGSNYGLMSLNSNIGSVKFWEKSTDSTSAAWTRLSNFTIRQDFRDLEETTFYRATVQNGVCSEAQSGIATITVTPNTDAGYLIGDTAYCSVGSSGNVEVIDQIGDVVRWESSETGANPWVKIADTSSVLAYSNLVNTTFYRAIIKSGVCSQLTTPVAIVEVYSASSGGTITSQDTAQCEGINFGSLTLAGNEGNIEKWESSSDGGVTWKYISNTTSQEYYFNLKNPTWFRVIVQNNGCEKDTSNELFVNVYSEPVGGIVDPISEACQGIGTGVIKLKSHAGKIEKWQTAATLNDIWMDVANVTDSIVYANQNQDIYYRAVLSNGVCGSVNSKAGLLKVYTPTVTGTLLGGGEVCDSANTGEIFVQGQVGSLIDWETSLSPASPFSSAGLMTATYTYFNINSPLSVRAKIKNGVCPDAYTNAVTFSLNPNPQPDFDADGLCGGRIATFTDKSTILSGSIVDHYWAVSDGFTTGKKDFKKAFISSGEFLVNLRVRSDKGCTSEVTRSVVIDEAPTANFRFIGGLTADVVCSTDSITCQNLTNDPLGAGLDYFWDFGDGTTSTLQNPKRVFSTPGTFIVKLVVSSPAFCSDSLSRFITVYKTVKPTASADASISKGIGYQLKGSGGLTYSWTPAEFLSNSFITNPIADIDVATEFILETTDINGCTGRDSIFLTVVDDYKIRPNNVITPDGNGANDVWIISNIDNYPDNTVSVFDRWGRLVFETTDYQNDWGATNSDGSLLVDGTYYYVVSFESNSAVYKGAITIVRNK